MEWIKFSEYNLPPQGKKIVCFKRGDLWVARRLNYKGKDYYIEIPFGGEEGALSTAVPEYWLDLDFPEGFTGYVKLAIDGEEPITLDQLQSTDGESHNQFVEMILNTVKNLPDEYPVEMETI